jgi:hypothetical protein
MNRRELLKFSLLSPLAGLFKTKSAIGSSGSRRSGIEYIGPCEATFETTGTEGHFWMQVYGPYYDPRAIDPHWDDVASSLTGVYSGEVLIGQKASEHPVGTVIVLNDGGRRYHCFELNERTYMKKGSLGVFLR